MNRTPGREYFLFDTLFNLIELGLYVLSLAGPVALLWELRGAGLPWLVLLAVLLWPLAGVVFGALLVILARALVWRWPRGRMLLTSRRAIAWFVLDRFMKMMYRSPFRVLLEANNLLRLLFYRGMGAGLDWTFMAGQDVKLTEPWLVRLGRNVLLGDGAHLAAHKVEGNVVTLDEIEIGDGTVIGAGAIVFPGCRIGNNVTVGAKSTVSRGTVIPDGETWVGIPARKLDYFSRSESQG
jgi:hypothetical protein